MTPSSLLSRTFGALGRFARPRQTKSAGHVIAIEQLLAASGHPRDYASFAREGLQQNAIVYRSVRAIAEAAASVPLLLYRGDEEIPSHPLSQLLDKPGPGLTGTDFIESLIGHLLISGNAYLEAVAIDGELRGLNLLRPDRVRVVGGADGWVEAYDYTVDGRTVRIAGEAVEGVPRILHQKLFHPLSDHYGLSPIEPAASAIDIHNTASRWNKALLDNSARPSGALVYTAGGELSPEQFARLKTELSDSFQGARNAGRPLLLEGGLDWKAMSLSPRDLDFIESKHAAAREIALAFGVPPMLLAIPGDTTYSNYQEAQRAFWRQTVIPLALRLARALSRWLGPAWDETLELRPDLDDVPALADEREALWARIDKASFLTRAEKRAAVGYDSSDDGSTDDDGLTSRRPAPRGGVAASNAKTEVGQSAARPFDRATEARFNPYHDERGRFTTAEGVVDEGDESALVLAQIEGDRQYSVDLHEEEEIGGHTLREHVGRSDQELLTRLEYETFRGPLISVGRKAVGTFSSREAANDFTNRLLQEKSSVVDLVASGKLKSAWLEMRVGSPTGREAFRPDLEAASYVRNTFNTGAYIVHDRRTARGYRVRTAYPLND